MHKRTFFLRLWKKNRPAAVSAVVIAFLVLGALLGPMLCSYGYEEIAEDAGRLAFPSCRHLLGTDEAGRDVLTRLLYGSRISLLVGLVPTAIAVGIGVALGILAGCLGGRTDAFLMRLADVMMAFPSMLLAMVIMYTLGDGLMNIFLALALVNWAGPARIVRAETLKLCKSQYVEAARSMGVSPVKIMLRHIFPNCLPSVIVLFTLQIPSAILSESALSFLGLGIQKPMASWGLMVNGGRQFLYSNPWLCLAPGGAIMLTALSFHFLGDGLGEALDPYGQNF